MGFISSLRALFSRGAPGFNALELQILRETMARLDPISAGSLQRRIDQVNLVQRLAGGEEVNVYQMRNGKPTLDTSTAMRPEGGQSLLAKVSISAPDGTSISGKVWLVDGVLFSLEFDKPTEHLTEVESLVVSVQLAS